MLPAKMRKIKATNPPLTSILYPSIFMCSQIQVESHLNADIWDKYLKNYWDKQLGYLIHYGFPLDFDNNVYLGNNDSNHISAIDFKEDVEVYLQEEKKFGAILHPFNSPQIHNLHVSPFMTREKSDSNHRRLIVDLSFPPDHFIN